jgi:uncharacterized membrane protein YdbT with pleckstrin-like domain
VSILDKSLLPDEKIIYRTRKHLIIFFTPVVWIFVTLFFMNSSIEMVRKITWIPVGITLFYFLNQWLIYISSEFAITNKRILMREGFFFRHTNETRLVTIANVSVNQSLLGRALNYGAVVLHAFGGDYDPFTNINRPNDFQMQLQMQLDKTISQR